MKYIQIFNANSLVKEITEFKKDFKASELLPLIPQDWQVFASLDDSFAVIWKPETIEDAEAVQFVEILITKNFEWDDTVTMLLFQKTSEGGTVLDSLGEFKGFEVPKDSLVNFLKTFAHADSVNVLSTNPSRGNYYIALNIKQEAWDNRLAILCEVIDFVKENQLVVSVEVQDSL